MSLSKVCKITLPQKHLFLLGLAVAHMCVALPEDRDQAITIQSDRAERDELKGTTVYTGRVLMEQGSMQIKADMITIFNDSNKVNKLVATGTPAEYRQTPVVGQAPVLAQANTLEYLVDEETLRLIDNASLTQDGASLSGTLIQYDVHKSLVKANSDEQERVKMVIPAKSLGQSDTRSPESARPEGSPSEEAPLEEAPSEQAPSEQAPFEQTRQDSSAIQLDPGAPTE